MRQRVTLLAVGAVGLLGAFVLARSLAGVVASLLPALRTTRVDPMIALREQ